MLLAGGFGTRRADRFDPFIQPQGSEKLLRLPGISFVLQPMISPAHDPIKDSGLLVILITHPPPWRAHALVEWWYVGVEQQ